VIEESDLRAMSAFQQLREVMATALNIGADTIAETSTQGDFPAWDSVGHVHLMVALEDAFGVELQIEDFAKLASVPAILDYLRSRGID